MDASGDVLQELLEESRRHYIDDDGSRTTYNKRRKDIMQASNGTKDATTIVHLLAALVANRLVLT